jgi:hypothetical protein
MAVPVIAAPLSCSFATIRRPTTEKPRGNPTKLITLDIFFRRLCVFGGRPAQDFLGRVGVDLDPMIDITSVRVRIVTDA